ncbi:MAG: alpha/beta hydrolase [Flavobacteriales bacterium]|nr:alpha/beta hydrolase [Flavobacteriales bacterium]
MKALCYLTCCLLLAGCTSTPKEEVLVSRIETHEAFASEYVDARNVSVFLPRQYFEADAPPFRVLYMHDGQNVFTPETAYGGVAWEADSALQAMMDSGSIPPSIIVAISNNGMKRYAEYCPEKPFLALDSSVQDSVSAEYNLEKKLADEYLLFITKELKPFIDSNYKTYTDPGHTFMMGSSMGGLISCYALLEYPDVFGGAACLSTHWPFSHSPGPHPFPEVMEDYVAQTISRLDSTHRLYFDYGTVTLDSLYPPYQQRVDSIIDASDWNGDHLSLQFIGAEHNENSWKARIGTPLSFLLKNW